jgi:RNA polymerase sigma factor (sigma-70 family)
MSPGIPTRLLATQSDERLLALVRQGHERAFEALVHRYRKSLLGYCRRLSLPETRAEDIVQLALLKTWIAVREGAEVRDLKAWLYRVVHNTAVNALRDAAHDGESFADLELGSGSHSRTEESPLDRRLAMREALAEVAALPPMQRKVIVRTAVAGHSHEQVASDLGISHGAVRGLLYRARATLRTAITALTPPPLLAWLAGRSDQSTPAPERLTELAGGGAAAGLGGLLLKGGVAAITAGTVLTGAAVVVHDSRSHHRPPHRLSAALALAPAGGAVPSPGADPEARRREGAATGSRVRRRRGTRRGAARGAPGARRLYASAGGDPAKGPSTALGGSRAPRSTARTPGGAPGGAPETVQLFQSAPPPSGSGTESSQAPGSSAGSSQAGGSGQGGQSGAGSGGPAGSAAGAGSGAGAGGSSGQGSAEGSGASQSGAQSGSGSGQSGPEGTGGQDSSGESSGSDGSSGSEPSSGSSGEKSGSLVGTVVHEVGGLLEHVLH